MVATQHAASTSAIGVDDMHPQMEHNHLKAHRGGKPAGPPAGGVKM